MVNIDLLHKDASPADTIARIHNILESVGLRRESLVISWKKAWDHCHSCHIYFRDYPLLAANGKGLTEELTYASALAEYIERLQCLMEYLFTRAGNIHRLPRLFPARERTASDIRADVPAIFERGLHAGRDLPAEHFACVPFVDVFGKRVVDLPFELLFSTTGTNGMASGNTPAEALCHAICEVFERYVIRRIADTTLPGLPTIPFNKLRIQHPLVRRLIDVICAEGLEILVKDGSLGGSLPVLAVALIDRNAGACAVSFGSDPSFEVALSRCLTEALQGADRVNRPICAGPTADAPIDIYNNTDVLLYRMTGSMGEPDFQNAFTAPTGNRRALAFLLERVKRLGRQIYIHDASVLGFPSYFVYVEDLSPVSEIPEDKFSFIWREIEEVRRTIFNIDSCSREVIARVADVLFQELTRVNPLLEVLFERKALHAPIIYWIGFRPLLTAMLIESGEYAKARTVLNWPRTTCEPEPEAPDSGSVRAFRELLAAYLAAGVPDALMPAAPGDTGCSTLPTTAFPRLLEKQRGYAIGSTETFRRRFEGLPIPRCLSVYACPSCTCRKYCFLDNWYRLALTLRAAARPAGSQGLLEVVSATL